MIVWDFRNPETKSYANDKVIKKLMLLYQGPFYIRRSADPNWYIIGDEKGKEIGKYNIVNLKLYEEVDGYS